MASSCSCLSFLSLFGASGWSCRGVGADFMEAIVIDTFTRYTAHKVQKVTAVMLRFIVIASKPAAAPALLSSFAIVKPVSSVSSLAR